MIPMCEEFPCEVSSIKYYHNGVEGKVIIIFVVRIPDHTISGDIRREYVRIELPALDE